MAAIDFSLYLKFFVGLFAIINPLGLLPVFVSLTGHMSPEERRKTNTTAHIAVMIILMNLLGYGLGPQVAGILSDAIGRAGMADPLRWALVCTSCFFILASLFFRIAQAALARDLAKPQPD